MSTDQRVAIVGAGLIGCAWAAIFARAGWQVRLTDRMVRPSLQPPRALRRNCRLWRVMVLHRSLTQQRLGYRWRPASQMPSTTSRSCRRTDRRRSKTRLRSLPSSTALPHLMRCSRRRHRPSSPRVSRKICRVVRDALSVTRSIRPISYRWSNYAARRGRHLRRSRVHARFIAVSGKCRSP